MNDTSYLTMIGAVVAAGAKPLGEMAIRLIFLSALGPTAIRGLPWILKPLGEMAIRLIFLSALGPTAIRGLPWILAI